MDLKIKDVADLLNVSETTIRRWLTDGKIPAYKINHQYRFNRLEIEDWVMGQRVNAKKIEAPSDPVNQDRDDFAPTKGGRQQFSLFRAIHQGDVFLDIAGTNKQELIYNTVQRIAKKLDLDPEVTTRIAV